MLLPVLALVAAVYAPVSSAWFCGYDDFHELARAAYEFGPEPTRILTRSNGDGLRYRPLHPAVTVATWSVAGMSARVYRTRNIALHLLNVALVYALGLILLGAPMPAAIAAGLFGIHPLANQAVNGALWTNTLAYAFALGGTVLTLRGCSAQSHGRRRILLGATCALLGVLVYEPTAALLALPWVALLLGGPARPGAVRWLAGAQLAVVAFAGALRLVALPQGYETAIASMPTMSVYLRNLVVSFGAMLLPLDAVLAADVWGTPLPSEVDGAHLAAFLRAWAIPLSGAATAMLAVATLLLRRTHQRSRPADERARAHDGTRGTLFALTGAVLPLAVTFSATDHPSETYLYGPVAFVFLALVVFAWSHLRSRQRTWGAVAAVVLAGSFIVATSVRNQRVMACGRTAARIVAELPERARTVTAPIVFANSARGPQTTRYGLYGYRGIHTIGHGDMADRGVSAALQLSYGDWRRKAEVRPATTLATLCASAHSDELRVLVAPEGGLEFCPHARGDPARHLDPPA